MVTWQEKERQVEEIEKQLKALRKRRTKLKRTIEREKNKENY